MCGLDALRKFHVDVHLNRSLWVSQNKIDLAKSPTENDAEVLDLQVGTFLLAGRIPAKATNHRKSLLVTRYLIGNRNGKREG